MATRGCTDMLSIKYVSLVVFVFSSEYLGNITYRWSRWFLRNIVDCWVTPDSLPEYQPGVSFSTTFRWDSTIKSFSGIACTTFKKQRRWNICIYVSKLSYRCCLLAGQRTCVWSHPFGLFVENPTWVLHKQIHRSPAAWNDFSKSDSGL